MPSGLYAGIICDKIVNTKGNQWRSPSAGDRDLPFNSRARARRCAFLWTAEDARRRSLRAGARRRLEPSGVKNELHLTFYVAEEVSGLREQVDVYRRTLAIWLGGTGVVLLLLLVVVLRWSLAPLRKVVGDLARVERGSHDHLDSAYPLELSGLTTSLNSFIDAERDRLMRYRNTLSDLAHSLKTPLAVMRSQLESGGEGENLRWTVLEQVGRMDEIVAYQLSRAATSGHQTFAAPLPIEPYAEEIVRSLEKVYAHKGVLCEFEIAPAARFHGDQGDLLELLGNLLENAFKWARRRVLLSANVLPGGSGGVRAWSSSSRTMAPASPRKRRSPPAARRARRRARAGPRHRACDRAGHPARLSGRAHREAIARRSAARASRSDSGRAEPLAARRGDHCAAMTAAISSARRLRTCSRV